MPGAGDREKPRVFGDGNLVCKKQVGHAISVPDREERHLLSKDLGSGEPNPGLRPINTINLVSHSDKPRMI